ncbi:hypothetical protein [Flavobacterium sp. J27]|uniref:hypothetical protein n=1 Tax=Flavobacterium sp. J27 TaxID=2060419 RepID=UPI0010302026|nr:hypothetical protein [Flavobacterium sp. J27]
MIPKTDISEEKNNSFENAHFFNELAKALHRLGDDIENSVGLFDAIGEKNETFTQLEATIEKPMLDTFIEMQNMAQPHIFKIVFKSFVEAFTSLKDHFNFIHYAAANDRDLTFFISTKNEKIKDNLENLEFDYFTGHLQNYLEVNFCFLEEDMEKDLFNTEKLELNA